MSGRTKLQNWKLGRIDDLRDVEMIVLREKKLVWVDHETCKKLIEQTLKDAKCDVNCIFRENLLSGVIYGCWSTSGSISIFEDVKRRTSDISCQK